MTEAVTVPETRVSSLNYRIAPIGKLQFREDIPARLECLLRDFTALIEPPSAKFTPTRDFHTVEEARATLDPQLESWRVWAHLMEGSDLLPFDFQEATSEVVNVRPDTGHLIAGPSSIQFTGQIVSLVHRLGSVPVPPQFFVVDDLVRVGFALYVDAEALPRHCLKIAYGYLTIIEAEHGDQASVARDLGFSNTVLSDFKDLCSRGGSSLEARKYHKRKTGQRIEFTDERRIWLLHVFRELLLRQGQLTGAAQMPPIFVQSCPGSSKDFRR